MKSRKSKFRAGILQHTYKITKDFGILFYRIEDRLMMFTIQSVMARKHNIRVVAASYMFTHMHEGTVAADKSQLDAFERDCMNTYVKAYNNDVGRDGRLFKTPYGFSLKVSDKERRHCCLYILNNHVEKKLVKSAIHSRWDFLAYYHNPNPFSEPLVKRKASYYLREACSIVDHEYDAGRYLRSALLRGMMRKINKDTEKEQLIDYIITKYMFIDFDYCINLFGSFDELILAADSVTGYDYDIDEKFNRYPDTPYAEMIPLAEKDGLLGKDMMIYKLSESELEKYAIKYRRLTAASEHHINSFFRKQFWTSY